MPQIGWQLPGLLSKNKEMKKCAWSGCLQWIYTSRPKKGKSPQQPDKFYTWKNWKGCIWIFIFIESYYVFFFQFDHRKYRIIHHMTTLSRGGKYGCYPGPLPIMSFIKVCNMWNCQQTVKKASHTRLQTQLGRLVKSYGSWCLCLSSQKVISNQVCYNKIKNKIIIITIVIKMLNSQFYCSKERLVESFLMISMLQ